DRCCLCGKGKDQVPKLIVGLNGAVCSECVDLCNDILQNDSARPEPAPTTSRQRIPDFTSMTRGNIPKPKEIVQYLDSYVIGQEHAKRAL
ncbi:ClpX C4-type zinc finger protein, partial [Acinetobacter baumannii]